ncbi:PH domain-containing protein [Kribbella sandramycini]|uniref:PH domain-containing protein n=1 Tax=Kribbella sandramycini TaxID=60450 RepID=A0A7Y4P2M6_9ACTN|nr:PH domain-containing protein [Kribbella sandramycini]MBB6565910.1 putative membrane protein [Kribbella sandramycini]NOL44916.1 PH domain-containing protein [Kribbella sandramycini]
MSDWQRLDPKAVAVAAVLGAGVAGAAGVPTAAGIASGTSWPVALLWVVPPVVLLIVGAAVLEHVRWRRTQYRISADRAELHSGLVVLRRRTLTRDRIRSVDLTANPILRIFGLVAVRIGTGEQTDAGEGTLTLTPVTRAEGERLRQELLRGATTETDGTLAQLDPGWIRYAPTSFVVPVLGFGAGGAVMQVSQWFGLQEELIDWVQSLSSGVPLLFVLLILAALLMVVGVIGSLGLFVEMWWNYRLDREPGTLRVRRGLFTTRSISVEERRLRGVDVVEPLGARLLGAARVDAIATGLAQQTDDEKTDHKTLLPVAPKGLADRIAAAVLREEVAPTAAARLTPHPRAAFGRRLRIAVTVALVPVLLLTGLGVWLTGVLIQLAAVLAVLALPAAVLLARESYRSLGHGLTGNYLVTRSGALRRSTAALQRDGVIGWRIRQTIFQRRLGLATFSAVTAAGSGAYSIRDADADEGLVFAESAVPDLLTPFTTSITTG